MRKRKYVFDFVEVPKIGTVVTYFGGNKLTLVDVEPYTRKDGTPSQLLIWQASDGRKGASGLKGDGLTWRTPA